MAITASVKNTQPPKFLLFRINLALHVFSRYCFTATESVSRKGAIFLQCNNTAGVQSVLGSSEYGALCRSKQSNQATPSLPPMDRQNNGGIFPSRRSGKREGNGDKSHV